jgi:chemotaxis protein MotB
MVSYADFMTLLFAFFVVLYASSSVNDHKFEKMSQALVGIFEQPGSFALPITLSEILPPVIYEPDGQNQDDEDYLDIQSEQNNLQTLLEENLKTRLTQPEFTLQKHDHWLKLEVQADALFLSNSATLSVEGEGVLIDLAQTFSKFKHPINIEVYNDVPVDPEGNPWQLSAMQGASIVHLLTLDQIDPTRLALVAYGPFHPVATNDDEEGKKINRRVIFMIDRTGKLRDHTKTVTDVHLSANP